MDENELVIVAGILVIAMTYYYRNHIVKEQVHGRDHGGEDFVRECLHGHRRISFDLLRMEPEIYQELCHILRDKGLLKNTPFVSVEQHVAIFLNTVGQNERNRAVQYTFQHSGETISRHFGYVLDAICSLGREYIVPPSNETPSYIRTQNRFYPYFKDCLGAIDGTHIPAWVPVEEQGRFRNRKGFISQNVMAVVGFDMKFQYVLAGWEGSASDSKILYDALSRTSKPLQVPQGKYFLVDAGYPNMKGFLAPFRGVRYHLKEFSRGSDAIKTPKELYNRRHSQLRNVVERTFGLLKSRFPILQYHMRYPYDKQVKIVLACCTLHNFIISQNASARQFPEVEDIYSAGGEELDDAEDIGPNMSRSQREAWAAFRDQFATQLWANYNQQ